MAQLADDVAHRFRGDRDVAPDAAAQLDDGHQLVGPRRQVQQDLPGLGAQHQLAPAADDQAAPAVDLHLRSARRLDLRLGLHPNKRCAVK